MSYDPEDFHSRGFEAPSTEECSEVSKSTVDEWWKEFVKSCDVQTDP